MTNAEKKCIMQIKQNNYHTRNMAGVFAGTEERGENPRRRNGTVKCECFFLFVQKHGHLKNFREGFARKARGF